MHSLLINTTQSLSHMQFCILYITICLITTVLFTALFCPVHTKPSKISYSTCNNIDFIKIPLTYAIILYHQYQSLGFEKNGFYCVEGFFIISGFLFHHCYTPQKNIKDFISRKLIRFMPYIILSNLLMLFIYNSFDLIKFISGVFMFACTSIFPDHTYYGPTWYLIVLFWITLFYLTLLKSLKKDLCNIIIGAMTLLTLFSTHNVISPVFIAIEKPSSELPLLTNGFIRGFVGIGFGYFLANLYSPNSKKSKNSLLFYTFFELFLLAYFAYVFFIDKYTAPYIQILICYCFFFWSFFNHKSYLSDWLEKINWKPISKYMLPIFMTHWFFCELQTKLNLWNDYQATTRIVLCLICSTFFGFISFHTITLGNSLKNLLKK